MGRQIVQVPPGFEHPRDATGEYIDGAHHEVLWHIPAAEKTAWQVYQNTSAGTPVSPVFEKIGDLRLWLTEQGYSESAIDVFLGHGHAPVLSNHNEVIRHDIEAWRRYE